MNKFCKQALDSARALDTSVGWTCAGSLESLGIRAETKRLLMHLAFSQLTASREQQIHCLFVALTHLDNVEKKIRVSGINEELIRLERIFESMRSLQKHLFDYIGYLMELEQHHPGRCSSGLPARGVSGFFQGKRKG
jgi:hypothetical protein